ncbi:MAG: histidinol-phosphate transaminase [Nitrososphaerales archaeon]
MSTRDIATSIGLSPKDVIRMDTNTSPYLPRKHLSALAKKMTNLRVNDYPDTSYVDLRNSLSRYCGIGINRFVITSGADEALDIIAKTLLDSHDEVVIPNPTYSMFRVVSEIMDSRVLFVPRKKEFKKDNFAVDVDEIARKVSDKTKIIFICNPNNPTGNSTSQSDVEFLLDSCPGATIVIDEAYYEFSGRTLVNLTEKSDNVLIVRTFSKAFSMAGARVGYIVASEKAAENLNIVRPPNSLSVISLALAQASLEDLDTMLENVRAIVGERERCVNAMRGIPQIEVFPSEANFILFQLKNEKSSENIHKALMKHGFVLRNFSETPVIEGCLRVTINTRTVNDSFLRALSEALSNNT